MGDHQERRAIVGLEKEEVYINLSTDFTVVSVPIILSQ
jgi:hypothetical protein